jgi:hypothetical protein
MEIPTPRSDKLVGLESGSRIRKVNPPDNETIKYLSV